MLFGFHYAPATNCRFLIALLNDKRSWHKRKQPFGGIRTGYLKHPAHRSFCNSIQEWWDYTPHLLGYSRLWTFRRRLFLLWWDSGRAYHRWACQCHYAPCYEEKVDSKQACEENGRGVYSFLGVQHHGQQHRWEILWKKRRLQSRNGRRAQDMGNV